VAQNRPLWRLNALIVKVKIGKNVDYSIYIAHRRVRRKAGGQAGGPAVKPPLMRSRHCTRAAGQPGHRPQPAHTGLGGDLTIGRQRQSAVVVHVRNE